MFVDNFRGLSLICAKENSAIANGAVRNHQVFSTVDGAANR
jgi:hypothetical protein